MLPPYPVHLTWTSRSISLPSQMILQWAPESPHFHGPADPRREPAEPRTQTRGHCLRMSWSCSWSQKGPLALLPGGWVASNLLSDANLSKQHCLLELCISDYSFTDSSAWATEFFVYLSVTFLWLLIIFSLSACNALGIMDLIYSNWVFFYFIL